MNGNVTGIIENKSNPVVGLDSYGNSILTVTGKTELTLKSESGYVLGAQAQNGGQIITNDFTVNAETGGTVNGIGLFGGRGTFNGIVDVTATGGTTTGVLIKDSGAAHFNKSATIIANGGTGQAWGLLATNQSEVTFDGKAKITVNGDKKSGQEQNVVRVTERSTVNFEGDTTLTLDTGSGGYGLHVVASPSDKMTQVSFNGDKTLIDVTASTALAVNTSGQNTLVKFTGQNADIVAHGQSKAVAINTQYGGVVEMDANATLTVDADQAWGIVNQSYGGTNDKSLGTVNVNSDISITANGKSQAIGIASSVSGNEAVHAVSDNDGVFVKGNANITVTVTEKDGEAYGVYVDNEKNGEKTPNGRVELNNAQITVTGTNGANAFGVAGTDNGHITIHGDALVTAKGENSYGIALEGSDLTLNGTSTFTGEKLGVSLDETAQVNVGDGGKLSTNTMDSTGTTSLGKDSTLRVEGEAKGASKLGNVVANGSTIELGSGTFGIKDLSGNDKTIVAEDLSAQVIVAKNTGNLALGTTGEANDGFANVNEAAHALQGAIKVETGDQANSLYVEEGKVNDGFSAAISQDGEFQNVVYTKNSTLDAYSSVATLAAFQWRHDLNSAEKRMGELRLSPNGVGAWARVYGSEQEYGAQNVTAKNHSIQVGVDTDVGSGWKVGAAFTYTDGTSTYDFGQGDNKAYGITAYGTWLADNGQFVDLTAKYSRLDNDFDVNGMAGGYNNNAYGLSAEYGWHFKLADVAFVEPQVEVMYGQVLGDDFTAANGVKIEQEDFESLIARAGIRSGFYFPENKGVIYARASVLHDFKGEMESTARLGLAVNSVKDDIGGTWYEIGLGANFNITPSSYVYVDLERTNGGAVVENWRYNLGVRYVY